MSNKVDKRKNFSTNTIEEVYTEQGGVCANCDRSLFGGYHAHHKNGNNFDNNIENCQLLCISCHGGKQYITLQEQKKVTITDLDALIKTGIEGKASGATIERLLDAIKMKLSLERQLLQEEPLQPPAAVKAETYITVMEHGLRKYEEGYRVGFNKGIEMSKEKDK